MNPKNDGRSSHSLRWHAGMLVAIVCLNVVHIAMKFVSYRTACLWLIRLSPTPEQGVANSALARSYGRLVNHASHLLPWVNCIRSSLILWWLLRWANIPSEIRIGIRYDSGMTGHAWVEHHGQVVNDVADVALKYPHTSSNSLAPEKIAYIK